MLPYAAYLRVYEPVEALAANGWTAHGEADESWRLTEAEQERSLHALVRAPAVGMAATDSGTAYLLERKGQTFAAPGDELLRSWLALARLIGSLTPSSARALAPPSLVDAADTALRSWRRQHPDASPHVREATWRLPLPWLLVPAPDDRETYQVDGAETTRYLTPIVQSRRRVARAHAVARRHFPGSEEVAEIVDLGRWLEAFHAHSWVELDLAGLGTVIRDLDPDEPDRSLREVAEAVAALREDKVDASGEIYERITVWWGSLALREHAN